VLEFSYLVVVSSIKSWKVLIDSASRANQCVVRILHLLLGILEHAQGNEAMEGSYVGSILLQIHESETLINIERSPVRTQRMSLFSVDTYLF
jgi:hypothetical protein